MRHASPEAAIRHGFLAATARAPKAKEAAILLSSYRHYKDLYSTTPDAAAKLLAEGQSKPDPALDPRDLAAYTMVASLILNLDEVVSKE